MKALLAPALLLGLSASALAGCAGAAPVAVAPAAQRASVTAMLNVMGPTGYRVQTLTAWSLADVDHVSLALYKKTDGAFTAVTGATKTIARANLETPVTLSNLRMATEYKIVASALADAAGTMRIDNVGEKGTDADCSVVFTTPSVVTSAGVETIDDGSRSITIPVRLRNKEFSGQAGAGDGVAVTNGNIVNTTAPESF